MASRRADWTPLPSPCDRPIFEDSELAIDDAFVKVWQKRIIQRPDAVPGWFQDLMLRESSKLHRDIWCVSVRIMAADNHLEKLNRVRADTLILLGTLDRLNPSPDARALAARIPNARVQEIPNAGCVPHWDNPADVAEAINGHLIPP